MYAKSLHLCLTLCNPMDLGLQTLSMGILQARILEWVACPPPRDLPDPGIKPESLTSPALSGRFFTTSATTRPAYISILKYSLYLKGPKHPFVHNDPLCTKPVYPLPASTTSNLEWSFFHEDASNASPRVIWVLSLTFSKMALLSVKMVSMSVNIQ